MKKAYLLLLTSFLILIPQLSVAALQSTRWTYKENISADLGTVLQIANQKLGIDLRESDLQLSEEQILGNWKFQMWSQVINGLKVKGGSLRVWKNLNNGELVQAEAQFENPKASEVVKLMKMTSAYSRQAFSRRELLHHAAGLKLAKFRSHRSEDIWHSKYGPVRLITINVGSYYWEILKSLSSGKTLSQTRHEHPRSDLNRGKDEFEMPAHVYITPEEIGESREPSPRPRQNVTLKYLKKSVNLPTTNLFAGLSNQVYADSKHDDVKGQTEEGRAQGFWSQTYLKKMIQDLMTGLPSVDNSLDQDRIRLVGRFVSVQIHPDALTQFRPSYPLVYGLGASYMWKELPPVDGKPDWGLSLGPTFLGKPATEFWDFYNRPAPWRLEASPTDLMNEGFDEVQVYWTVNQWFETLHDLGFRDPELSTRPITAILFDPDIEGRDNAFYTDDTINFTTYSQYAANYARDTSTIWHELGHGLEDRILGGADYDGGLSEGMADLTADIMFNAMTQGQDFPGKAEQRIVNKVGFNLTNESHDEGEAYGGSMRDLSEKILKAQGMKGFRKFADLIFDAMRLSRNNPGLNLQEWFRRLYFADELGKAGLREPGEFANLIQEVAKDRNFSFQADDVASFPISVEGFETLTESSPGSRYSPIRLELKAGETKDFQLKIQVLDGKQTKLQYPVKVRISYRGGPLQGSSKFSNEEAGQEWTLTQSGQEILAPIQVLAGCDQINRNDQRCSDFAYIQLYNDGEKQPIAKKRFYVNVNALLP